MINLLMNFWLFWLVNMYVLRGLILGVFLCVCVFSFVYWMNLDKFIVDFQFCVF